MEGRARVNRVERNRQEKREMTREQWGTGEGREWRRDMRNSGRVVSTLEAVRGSKHWVREPFQDGARGAAV